MVNFFRRFNNNWKIPRKLPRGCEVPKGSVKDSIEPFIRLFSYSKFWWAGIITSRAKCMNGFAPSDTVFKSTLRLRLGGGCGWTTLWCKGDRFVFCTLRPSAKKEALNWKMEEDLKGGFLSCGSLRCRVLIAVQLDEHCIGQVCDSPTRPTPPLRRFPPLQTRKYVICS